MPQWAGGMFKGFATRLRLSLAETTELFLNVNMTLSCYSNLNILPCRCMPGFQNLNTSRNRVYQNKPLFDILSNIPSDTVIPSDMPHDENFNHGAAGRLFNGRPQLDVVDVEEEKVPSVTGDDRLGDQCFCLLGTFSYGCRAEDLRTPPRAGLLGRM
ncbi:hypothetical protein D9758_015781 [Tetrapyrgos nigripes]|uniref:Uncharacterized protein n=1 Tax=Tetrapyrgos nigripes TaxID=182062 RepID=A0A8H5C4E8_9AGAR|nr:hypothetical protein D9758_015781 [Tetrapyrgos nigripes]